MLNSECNQDVRPTFFSIQGVHATLQQLLMIKQNPPAAAAAPRSAATSFRLDFDGLIGLQEFTNRIVVQFHDCSWLLCAGLCAAVFNVLFLPLQKKESLRPFQFLLLCCLSSPRDSTHAPPCCTPAKK